MDDNVEGSVENTRQWLCSASSSDNDDKECKCRLPRIGDEYQVKIPKLKNKYNYQDSAVDILKSESSLKRMKLDDEADWKDIECKSFLLGLYTFGKNFCVVKKFVKTREMSDVLTYYYGKFYRSDGYLRWSRSRKMKGTRCIRKDKIYTGWRQNELLSRMFPHVSCDCKILLKKVARRFGEGKLSLEVYVFALKNMVGIDLLVEAVAIGKEKKDLTGTMFDHAKRNNVLIAHPKVPSGQAWSSLTKDEIIKCLRGVCRLNKTQLEDLFWEVVWPRLLARGWHSEQPRDYSHIGSKNSFVFLVPGVLKFFRRKLVRGYHYFDSVSEVLNKVASDPGQLEPEEFEVDTDKENCTSDPDPLSNQQQHCHHQLHNQDLLKLTGVDTSSIHGKLVKVRNLESLPVDTVILSSRSALYSETERGTTKVSRNETGVNNTSKLERASGVLTDLTFSVINTAFSYDPPLLPESVNAEPVLKSLSETSDHPELLNPSDDVTGKEEPAIETRRQSRRNRELTTKAFEAIALDLLGPKKKRKGVNSMSMSSSSRQVRGKTIGRSHIDAAGEDLATNQDDDTNIKHG